MSTNRDVRVTERRRDVAFMYLQGYKQSEIAVKHKVSQQQISLDLKFIHADWVAAARADFDEVKARELARIDKLESTYWAAWERSQLPQTKAVKEQSDGKELTRVEKTERVGDTKYLDGVRWCIEQRLKIFGVYEADKQQSQYLDWLKEHGYTESEAITQFRSLLGAKTSGGEGDSAGRDLRPPAADGRGDGAG